MRSDDAAEQSRAAFSVPASSGSVGHTDRAGDIGG